MSKHASDSTRPAPRRDHMWVLAVIAAACGLEVCATWTGIGSRSGFPVIRLPYGIARIPTDFCLMVCMEAYAGYALFIWLARDPGRRSGPFAMWSGLTAVVLSLTAQVAYHVTGTGTAPPRWLVGLVSALPVVALLLAAILIHLVRLDREDATVAAGESAAIREAAELREELTRRSTETAAWKAAWGQAVAGSEVACEAARTEAGTVAASEVAALRAELEIAQAGLETARDEAAEAAQRNEILARKLDAASRARKRAKQPGGSRASARAEQMTKDVDARTKALSVLAGEPGISGASLGPRVGMSKRWGQLHRDELVAMAADVEER